MAMLRSALRRPMLEAALRQAAEGGSLPRLHLGSLPRRAPPPPPPAPAAEGHAAPSLLLGAGGLPPLVPPPAARGERRLLLAHLALPRRTPPPRLIHGRPAAARLFSTANNAACNKVMGASVETAVQGTPSVTWKPIEISIGGIALSFIAMGGCILLIASQEEDQMLSLAITEMEIDLMNQELAARREIRQYMVQEIQQMYEEFVKNNKDAEKQLSECKSILLELKHDLTLLQEKMRE